DLRTLMAAAVEPGFVPPLLDPESIYAGVVSRVTRDARGVVQAILGESETLAVLARLKSTNLSRLESLYLTLQQACVPPRQVDALRRTINKMAKDLPPPPSPASSTPEAVDDPHRLARAYLKEQANGVKYFRQGFHLYTGTYWKARPDGEVVP